jgi:hypothetical protein
MSEQSTNSSDNPIPKNNKRKSYFSKTAISTVIEEVLRYIENENKEVKGFVKPTKQKTAMYLIKQQKINEAIFNELTEEMTNVGSNNCIALVKKGRCSNTVCSQRGSKFCSFHTANPPEITWEDYMHAKNKTKGMRSTQVEPKNIKA